MGCLQKSRVLHTEGIWTEATWLIAENVERSVLASDVFLQDNFYTSSLSWETGIQWKAALFLLLASLWAEKLFLPFFCISTALNSDAGHLVA